MKEGEEGSDIKLVGGVEEPANGGCIERPFMFRGFRAEGEVIGRSNIGAGSLLLLLSMVRVFEVDAVGKPPPNVGPGKDDSGIRLIGESGDEEGEGSDRDDVSVVSVVVGDESADSEFCVEVLSWCLWAGSVGNGRK